MTWPGLAWHGMALHGMALPWHGIVAVAWHGTALATEYRSGATSLQPPHLLQPVDCHWVDCHSNVAALFGGVSEQRIRPRLVHLHGTGSQQRRQLVWGVGWHEDRATKVGGSGPASTRAVHPPTHPSPPSMPPALPSSVVVVASGSMCQPASSSAPTAPPTCSQLVGRSRL